MRKEDNENEKCKDDEYSILENNIHKQDSLLKWMSFNKNSTQKSYNLDDIFKDETFISKKDGNNSNIIKQSILGKYDTVQKHTETCLDDMSKLKDNNISIKRYLESVKDDSNPFINDIKRSINGPSSAVHDEFNNLKDCSPKKMKYLFDSTIIPDQKHVEINKKDLLANISQIRGDLSKCTNLLKRKSELLNNSNLANEFNSKHIKISNFKIQNEMEKQVNIQNEMEDITQNIDTVVDWNTVDKVMNINQFHSSVIETKRRISEAIEEIQQKENLLEDFNKHKNIEGVNNISEIYMNKIEAHLRTEENYKKEINNLERGMKIKDIEISRLKSKLNYLYPQHNDVSLDNIIESGKNSINLLKKKLVQTENDVKKELENAFKNSKKLESEMIGLKKIINKLVDKIKTLKNKNE